MSDIKLQSSLLDNLIIKLAQDNLEIVDLIKNSNDAIRTLDDKKWKSKEKIEMDEKLIPYMNKLDNQLLNYLNECTDLLKLAKTSYEDVDRNISGSIAKIDSDISVEKL